ncbi:hypothetical protein [Chryseobacterium sp.]|uniref:hypothetical protein n=1 Tax=Chryseobacterium sp. TaxID=1871047 RepID=UPI00289742FA|nr:hypothetical protein [Chryseobacterium sp.]
MKYFKLFFIRLIIVVIPLSALYFYAQMAFESNRKKEHPTDVGLGIAILLFFILLFLSIGFLIDFIKNILKKEYKIALLNIPFLLFFLLPILYIGCQMTGSGCFCSWIINVVK